MFRKVSHLLSASVVKATVGGAHAPAAVVVPSLWCTGTAAVCGNLGAFRRSVVLRAPTGPVDGKDEKKALAEEDLDDDEFGVFEDDDLWFMEELLDEGGEMDFMIPEADARILQGEKK